MSYLSSCLLLFNLDNIDNILPDELRKLFKQKVVETHPDRGGSEEAFDTLLGAYLYLNELIVRVMGGRDSLNEIKSPSDLEALRGDEIINKIIEQFSSHSLNDKDIEIIKNSRIMVLDDGYDEWLKNKINETSITEKDNTVDFDTLSVQRPDINIVKNNDISSDNFNNLFEINTKQNKPVPTSIIMYPDAMATISGTCIGANIFDDRPDNYTSDFNMNPVYSDLYSAFAVDNTIIDKIPSDCVTEKNITYEDLIQSRIDEIKPLSNDELSDIAEYEKKQLEKQRQHISRLKTFTDKGSLNITYNSDNNVKNDNENENDNENGFIKTF
jgi:hypothetical protein